MVMQAMRYSQLLSYLLLLISAPTFLWLISNNEYVYALIVISISLFFIIIGLVIRDRITSNAKQYSKLIGLNIMLVYPVRENDKEIILEAHLNPYYKGMTKSTYRNCFKDVDTIANHNWEKDVVIYLTTHSIIRKGWFKAISKYSNISAENIKNIDRLAGKSRFEWYAAQKKMYGRWFYKPAPKWSEYQSIKTIIRRKPIVKNHSD